MSAGTSSKEGAFKLWDLLLQLMTARRSGDDLREQINELIRHDGFQSRGKKICGGLMRRYGDLIRRYYGASDDADDLFNEACARMFEKIFGKADALSPEKTESEEDFFDWFFILARNIVFSKLRKFGRLPDEIFFVSTEDLSLANERTRFDLERARNQFLGFTETLPENHRHAVRLWYEGYSTREIKELLGHVCSHVTIKNWVSAAVKAFRKTIDRDDD